MGINAEARKYAMEYYKPLPQPERTVTDNIPVTVAIAKWDL